MAQRRGDAGKGTGRGLSNKPEELTEAGGFTHPPAFVFLLGTHWQRTRSMVQGKDHVNGGVDFDGLAREQCGCITPFTDRIHGRLGERAIALQDNQMTYGTVLPMIAWRRTVP